MVKKIPEPVIGPVNTAPQRFEEFWENLDWHGLPMKEIAQLAFDAGHSFWHEKNDPQPICPKEN